MHKIIKEDITNVLKDSILAVESGKISDLSQLSDHVIHDASIFQDDDTLSIAILVYALSKIIARCCEKNVSYALILKELKDAVYHLEKNNFNGFRNSIKNLFRTINKYDKKIKLYIEEVINKAKLKKGSKLYKHGLSIARASEILGISQWEMMNYIGKTFLPDEKKEGLSAKQRLNIAREIFTSH